MILISHKVESFSLTAALIIVPTARFILIHFLQCVCFESFYTSDKICFIYVFTEENLWMEGVTVRKHLQDRYCSFVLRKRAQINRGHLQLLQCKPTCLICGCSTTIKYKWIKIFNILKKIGKRCTIKQYRIGK